eukprot:NODE_1709_length_1406_cov_24.825645_g1623_i0.p1 GENE.NODE_1709_length_1406_cov_24.825645_g1623_i0~~NODE_1709_length_1406_cov_24.825645_g1623_i0.p1  ORF type:complete len:432 (-),score=110.23 NODE_1709_length_1406_cov_24.825645_g1623_i0:23-1318(-)
MPHTLEQELRAEAQEKLELQQQVDFLQRRVQQMTLQLQTERLEEDKPFGHMKKALLERVKKKGDKQEADCGESAALQLNIRMLQEAYQEAQHTIKNLQRENMQLHAATPSAQAHPHQSVAPDHCENRSEQAHLHELEEATTQLLLRAESAEQRCLYFQQKCTEFEEETIAKRYSISKQPIELLQSAETAARDAVQNAQKLFAEFLADIHAPHACNSHRPSHSSGLEFVVECQALQLATHSLSHAIIQEEGAARVEALHYCLSRLSGMWAAQAKEGSCENEVRIRKQASVIKELQAQLRSREHRRLINNGDGHEAEGITSEEADLLRRLTSLQQTQWQSEEQCRALELVVGALRSDLKRKDEVIQHWLATRPIPHSEAKWGASKPTLATVHQMQQVVEDTCMQVIRLQKENRRLADALESPASSESTTQLNS